MYIYAQYKRTNTHPRKRKEAFQPLYKQHVQILSSFLTQPGTQSRFVRLKMRSRIIGRVDACKMKTATRHF